MADAETGYGKSGGWRFGGKKSSSDIFNSLYAPENYNGGLLDSVGNPKKGVVDAAVSKTPVENVIATGLLAPSGNGGYGLNTRLSDANWSDVKAMRDQIGPDGKMAGFSNSYDTPSLKAALAGLGSVFGGPMLAGKLIPQAMDYSQQSMNALGAFGGGTVSPMFGGDFGGTQWSGQINDNAQARQMRQQQSESEAQAIAQYQAQAQAEAEAQAAVGSAMGGGSGGYNTGLGSYGGSMWGGGSATTGGYGGGQGF